MPRKNLHSFTAVSSKDTTTTYQAMDSLVATSKVTKVLIVHRGSLVLPLDPVRSPDRL
jgi:hypothetical protein